MTIVREEAKNPNPDVPYRNESEINISVRVEGNKTIKMPR